MDKNSSQSILQFTNEGFVYNIVIDKTCELLYEEPFKSQLPHAGEINIDSEWFADHRQCQDDVGSFLISLSSKLKKITGRRYVIATKYNPMHDEESEEDEDSGFGPWDETMVLKMYLADAARLKNESAIDCSISATIRASLKVSLDSADALNPQ